MAISFMCSCGTAMNVPDDSAGRDAWCPTCRKKVPVPAAGLEPIPSAAPDRREASEFRPGALAQLLGPEAKAATGPAKAPEARPAAPSAPAESKPPAADRLSPAAVIEIFPDKVKFHCDCGQKVSVKLPASHSAGKCPKCGRSLKVPMMPGDGAGPGPGKDAAPKDRAAGKERVNCQKCGRLIEDLSAAFCPRCGFPLEIRPPATAAAAAAHPGSPVAAPAPQTAPPIPTSAQPPSAAVRQRNAREAAEAAADLLRPTTTREEAGQGPLPAGLIRRIVAFAIDLAAAAAVGAVAWRLAESAGLKPAWHGAAIGLISMLVINEVLFAAAAGSRSLGMLVCGIGVFRSSGQPAGLPVLALRLLAWPPLLIGVPLALFERQRRTLHDLICGTTVRQTTRE